MSLINHQILMQLITNAVENKVIYFMATGNITLSEQFEAQIEEGPGKVLKAGEALRSP